MDGGRFDAWTRRKAALGLGGLLAGLLGPAAAAKKKPNKKKKKKSKACDAKQRRGCRREGFGCEAGKCVVVCRAANSACGDTNVIQLCGPQGSCECSSLTNGGFACAVGRPETCPAASECASNAQCGAGEVCVDVSHADCCGGQEFGLCRKACKSTAPGF